MTDYTTWSCTADYNATAPCCGQPDTGDGVVTCPAEAPVCYGYDINQGPGTCYAQTSQTCTADFGSDVPCCGQPNTPNDYEGNVSSCSADAPFCRDYVANQRAGACYAQYSYEDPEDPEDPTQTNWVQQYWPFIAIVVVLVILAVVFFLTQGNSKKKTTGDIFSSGSEGGAFSPYSRYYSPTYSTGFSPGYSPGCGCS